jgi:membrane protease YdiL (CAAX protease family)
MSRMNSIFFNKAQQRLRTGWRLLTFIFVFGLFNAMASALRRFAFGSPPADSTAGIVLLGTLLLLTATGAVYLSRRFVDKKSFRSLGLRLERSSVIDFIFGFLLSGLMVSIIFFVLVSFGWLNLQGLNWPDNPITGWLQLLLLFIGIGITVGWWEELVFRGYILQNLMESIGLGWAIGLSCLFYGLIHLLNPNANLLSALVIAFIGYLRIFGWLRTQQLWLSMGMHAGWNFLQGPIFGFSVSGRESYTLFKHTISGPSWITGGDFGPEGGLAAALMVIIGIVGVEVWTRNRKPRLDLHKLSKELLFHHDAPNKI